VDLNVAIFNLKKAKETLQLDESADAIAGQAPVWQQDAEADKCPFCNAPFTLLFRKHHCRLCGKVVCGNCSTHYLLLANNPVKQRVCDLCYQNALDSQNSQQ